MAIDPISASRAYQAAARALKTSSTEGGSDAGAAGGLDFGNMVKGAVEQTTAATKAAEKMGMQAAAGRADIVDVVTAIAAAETTLETMITVRNQVIQAYQEILRMPI
ncbi:MAG: flagellar hook-basal body complex protein FliE [Alphaproteobacteria bacterium]|nr:flagellar hook-basal body complex protein FliE [Alphaproteobacteria bacterium]